MSSDKNIELLRKAVAAQIELFNSMRELEDAIVSSDCEFPDDTVHVIESQVQALADIYDSIEEVPYADLHDVLRQANVGA